MIKVTFMDAYTFNALRVIKCLSVSESIAPTHICLEGVDGEPSRNMLVPVKDLVIKTEVNYED